MSWAVPKIWDGADVWILGGGPSLTKQFDIPDKVVQEVRKGVSPPSVYSPYMSAIHNKHVIGVNVAYLIGNWIDMVFFGDSGFFERNMDQLANFPGIRITCFSGARSCDWVKCVDYDTQHRRGISPNPNKVSWNRNSGAAAISIAANTGAKRIILVGFDMKLDDTSRQHWHDIYGRGEIKEPRRIANLPFPRHLAGFQEISFDAKKRGIEIINACPDSAITQFRKTTVKELL
jgi:hypothetical protein